MTAPILSNDIAPPQRLGGVSRSEYLSRDYPDEPGFNADGSDLLDLPKGPPLLVPGDQNPRHQAPAIAHSLVGAATDKSRRHRACQQDMAWAMMAKGERYKEPVALAA